MFSEGDKGIMEMFDSLLPYIFDLGFVLIVILIIYSIFTIRRNKSHVKKALQVQQKSIQLQENALEALHETNKKLETLINEVRQLSVKIKGG